MALPDINLDDRSFDQLFAFMRKQIDTEEWVDHNLSDPGIVLLDLLCWIGEMVLYRANRVPPAHIAKFADLVVGPPEPVTVPLTLTTTLASGRQKNLVVQAGTRFATDFVPDASEPDAKKRRPRRYIFETLSPVTFRAPANQQPPTEQSIPVTAREYLAVSNEVIGTSNGKADQVFPLRPVCSNLGLPPDALAPVLLDFDHADDDYKPNPHIVVDGDRYDAWTLKRFLLTEESRVTPTNPAKHFMVDAEERCIRFGDGTFGSIPPPGRTITCAHYQLLQGPDALVAAGSLVHLLGPIPELEAGEKILVANDDAEGGNYFFPPEVRRREGLKAFRRPQRLITAADFEEVLLVDFNEYQKLAKRPIKVLRATALMNCRPPTLQERSPGDVTIVVLAGNEIVVLPPDQRVDLDIALRSDKLTIEEKMHLVDLAPELVRSIERFLYDRRLITTRTFVRAPTLTPVSVVVRVVVASDHDRLEMKRAITDRVGAFFGVLRGGLDKSGWPLGGSVHRSKLFRLIEDLDGVDHVETLTLSPADLNGDVQLEPLSLPVPVVTVTPL